MPGEGDELRLGDTDEQIENVTIDEDKSDEIM